MSTSNAYPRLRPVEAFPTDQDGDQMFVVLDPSGLAAGALTLSRGAMFILSLMDGEHSLDDILGAVAERGGRGLSRPRLVRMVEELDAARYLDSPVFAAYLQSRVDAYRSAPARVSGDEASLGTDDDGLAATIGRMLASCEVSVTGRRRRLAGLIAPHLDYARGQPVYADAYGVLAVMPPVRRFVILGTNHFGRATSPVATRKDFKTPLGLTRTDRGFLSALETRLGVDLCEHEFDHEREHSVELQTLILQQMFGADRFEIVPVLCSDPCGPIGTAPADGQGADLRAFSEALGELIHADPVPTVVIAGADLSHVGWRFGDARDLDKAFLKEVERRDREALGTIVSGGAEAFVATLKRHGNSGRVCSAGCVYALLTALPEAPSRNTPLSPGGGPAERHLCDVLRGSALGLAPGPAPLLQSHLWVLAIFPSEITPTTSRFLTIIYSAGHPRLHGKPC